MKCSCGCNKTPLQEKLELNGPASPSRRLKASPARLPSVSGRHVVLDGAVFGALCGRRCACAELQGKCISKVREKENAADTFENSL